MRILAISGSLRADSSNKSALQAAASLAPPDVEIVLYDGLSGLPHFNPDLDAEVPLGPVADWRAQLRASDGVLISSPEYAHGVPGSLKNALDWVVGTGEFASKPVALINTSPRAFHAQASLRETLTTMSAQVASDACIEVPLLGKKLDVTGILANEEIAGVIRSGLVQFAATIAKEEACHV
jgi:chromate reductase, NAD(P)H dehydrogenase (quinone)